MEISFWDKKDQIIEEYLDWENSTRWDEERNKVEVEIQIWWNLEEIIMFKDLIKLLNDIVDLFKELIIVKTMLES